MADQKHTSHLDQGTNGVRRMLKGPKGGADIPANIKKGPSISQRGGEIPAVVGKPRPTGDHLVPRQADVAGPVTPERQGGGIHGHDRTDPTLGKEKSKRHVATRVL